MPSLPAHAKLDRLANDIHAFVHKPLTALLQSFTQIAERLREEKKDEDLRAVFGEDLLKELAYLMKERHGTVFFHDALEHLLALDSDQMTKARAPGCELHVELSPEEKKVNGQVSGKIAFRQSFTAQEFKAVLEKEASVNGVGPAKVPALKRPTDLRLWTYRRITDQVMISAYKLQTGQVLLDCGFFTCRVVSEKEAQNVTMTDKPSFAYGAVIERVVDGDTLLVLIDLGFGNIVRERLRLRGVNTPELGTPEGEAAKAVVEKLLPPGTPLVIKSSQTDDYGRFVADVFYLNADSSPEDIAKSGVYLNQKLMDDGLAQRMQC